MDSMEQKFGELQDDLEAVHQPIIDRLQILLQELTGKNFGSYEANRRIAMMAQEMADRVSMAFVCPKCEQPGRFRCSESKTSEYGAFVFSHGHQTHGGTTTIPALKIVCAPISKKKRSS